jgi:DNA-binding NarL/FixJ family response regulator
MTKKLTEKNILVVKKLLQGKTSNQIASEIGISWRAVQNHKSKITKTMEARNITQAIAKIANKVTHKIEWK